MTDSAFRTQLKIDAANMVTADEFGDVVTYELTASGGAITTQSLEAVVTVIESREEYDDQMKKYRVAYTVRFTFPSGIIVDGVSNAGRFRWQDRLYAVKGFSEATVWTSVMTELRTPLGYGEVRR
jgi:hypothetical protein